MIVEYLDPVATEEALERLYQWPSRPREVVIVRNQCSEDERPLRYPSGLAVRELRNSGNCGFAKAFNRGLQAATAESILCLNADVTLASDAFEVLLRTLGRETGRPLVISPNILAHGMRTSGRRFYSVRSLLWARTRRGRAALSVPAGTQPDWVLGACFLARREELMALGGLDERFFLYFEDVDLCWRVWAAGGAVQAVPVTAEHVHHRASKRVFSRVFIWHVVSALSFFRIHPQALIGKFPSRSL